MTDPIYYYFPHMGIVLCEYHKDKMVEKDSRCDYEPIEPGSQLITEWCNSCTDIIIQYEKEVD